MGLLSLNSKMTLFENVTELIISYLQRRNIWHHELSIKTLFKTSKYVYRIVFQNVFLTIKFFKIVSIMCFKDNPNFDFDQNKKENITFVSNCRYVNRSGLSITVI